jgi:predicted nucleotidyltransferase
MATSMIDSEIKKFSDEIARRFRPHKIILFGSHAINRADAGSDVDMLVIMDFDGRPQIQSLNIRRDIRREFPLDLIVRRPSEVNDRLTKGDIFLKEIVEKGIVLYERPGQGMDR